MSQPINDRIIDNVMTTLAGVRQPGFNNTLTVELTDGIDPPSPADSLCVVNPGDVRPEQDSPLGHDRFWLPIQIVLFAVVSDASDDDLKRQRLATLAADVRKALGADRYRGNLANNTTFPNQDVMHLTTSPPCVVVTPEILYQTLRDNPYEQ